MQGQINEVITSASVVVTNPLILAMLTVAVVALATGLAGRLAIFVEDLHYSRRHRPNA